VARVNLSKLADGTVYLTGAPFAAAERLRALGGRWSACDRGWYLPAAAAVEARAAAASGQDEALCGVPTNWRQLVAASKGRNR
jgi:hypothetical protein